jgi:hypothetical protein
MKSERFIIASGTTTGQMFVRLNASRNPIHELAVDRRKMTGAAFVSRVTEL